MKVIRIRPKPSPAPDYQITLTDANARWLKRVLTDVVYHSVPGCNNQILGDRLINAIQKAEIHSTISSE